MRTAILALLGFLICFHSSNAAEITQYSVIELAQKKSVTNSGLSSLINKKPKLKKFLVLSSRHAIASKNVNRLAVCPVVLASRTGFRRNENMVPLRIGRMPYFAFVSEIRSVPKQSILKAVNERVSINEAQVHTVVSTLLF